MASKMEKKVRSFALYSRILVILMQAFFNFLMPDHDAKVFNPPIHHRENNWDVFINIFLGGFRRWDAVYFVHIAEYGYAYENSLAFFPLFPMLVRLLANTVFSPLLLIMNYSSVILVAAVCLNLFCFIQSAKILYTLGVKVLGDDMLSYKAAQLYCINPASIFFSAAYSESLFALLSFLGMSYVEDGCLLKAAFVFGFSGTTRANGIVNAGYILHKIFLEFFQKLSSLQKSKFESHAALSMALVNVMWFSIWSGVFLLTVCITPFILYQFYTYEVYCSLPAKATDYPSHVINYGNEHHYNMPHTGVAKWCHDYLPFSYFYVQNTHWDNGFLHYYQVKQIPNFLLAAPMVFLCVFASAMYIGKNMTYSVTLGLIDPDDAAHKKNDDEELGSSTTQGLGFDSKKCLVYVCHMLYMVMFGVLFMHVQVITRIIAAACPVLYWFVASLTISQDQLRTRSGVPQGSNGTVHGTSNKTFSWEENVDWDNHWLNNVIFVYFHLYFFVGVAAFSNFLPWT